jgi:hypothetical protein
MHSWGGSVLGADIRGGRFQLRPLRYRGAHPRAGMLSGPGAAGARRA